MQLISSGNATDVQTNAGNKWMKYADLNADGLVDLIYYTNSVVSWRTDITEFPQAFLQFYLQQSDGSFKLRENLIPSNFSPVMGHELKSLNVNNDGKVDFLLGGAGWDPYVNELPQRISVDREGDPEILYVSQADGTYDVQLVAEQANNIVRTHNTAILDIDRDGDDDFFVASTGSNTSYIGLNEGGNFTVRRDLLPDYIQNGFITQNDENGSDRLINKTNWTGALSDDFTGNGYADLVLLASAVNYKSILLENQQGSFSSSVERTLPDSVFGNGGSDQDYVSKGTVNLGGVSVDLTNDGDQDIIIIATDNDYTVDPVSYYRKSAIQFLENDGSGNFSVVQELDLTGFTAGGANGFHSYYNMEVIDINLDGFMDIVAHAPETSLDTNVRNTLVIENQNGVFYENTAKYIADSTHLMSPFFVGTELRFIDLETTGVAMHPTLTNQALFELNLDVYRSGEQNILEVESGVYRFYNTSTGTHFYSASHDEAENIQDNLSNFNFEGPSFKAVEATAQNAVGVHRFYNSETGTHFYTASEAERDQVQSNLPQFNYEGVSYYGYGVETSGSKGLHRFFNTETGVHFYTASDAEQDQVASTLSSMLYEGIAYWVDSV